jgi:hypothetical protein
MSTNGRLQRARERWGAQLPDWVEALARAADAEIARGGNLTSLGKRIALSGNQVSGVIGNTHPAGKARDAIEATVRGSLMKAEVLCPALGMVIGLDRCAGFQRQRKSAASPMAVRLAATCPGCPHAIRSKA